MGKGKHRTPNAERRMTERSQFEVALLSVLCELYVLSEDGEENVQRSTLNAQRPMKRLRKAKRLGKR